MKNDNTESEVWKDVKGYEGKYQVSNRGRVRSLDRILFDGRKRKGQILSSKTKTHNYESVQLGRKTRRYVHRLVAENFIENVNEYDEINHKDCNTKNNNVGNLEWCDRKYNVNYGNHNEKLRKTKRERWGKPIYVIYPDGTDEYHNSIRGACRELSCSQHKIKYAIKKDITTRDGFRFEKA